MFFACYFMCFCVKMHTFYGYSAYIVIFYYEECSMQKKTCLSLVFLCVFCWSFGVKSHASDFLYLDFWQEATVADVQEILASGVGVNDLQSSGETVEEVHTRGANLLEIAMGFGASDEVIDFLLKQGAHISVNTIEYADLPTLKKLLKYGANINELGDVDETPLYSAYALDVPKVKFLLEQGALFDVKTIWGDTALSILYKYKKKNSGFSDLDEKIRLLEQAGAVLGQGRTAREAGLITYKVEKNTQKSYTKNHNFRKVDFWRVATLAHVKQSFIEGENLVDVTDAHGRSVLELAVRYSIDLDVVLFMLDEAGALHRDIFLAAAQNENVEVLKELVRRVPPHGIDDETFMYTAIWAAEAALMEHVKFIATVAPRILYMESNGEKIWENERVKVTKARPDRAAIVELLRNFPKKYDKGHPYFEFDFWKKANLKDVQKAFIQGADLESINTWDYGIETQEYLENTVLQYAVKCGASPEAIDFLVKKGARISPEVMTSVRDLPVLKKLLALGGNINAVNAEDQTLLHSSFIDEDIAKYLIDQGALLDIRSKSGHTPFTNNRIFYGRRDNSDLLEAVGATEGRGKSPREAGIITYKVQKNTEEQYSLRHNYNNADFWRVATLEDVQQSFLPEQDINFTLLPMGDEEYGKSHILALAAQQSNTPAVVEFLLKKGAKVGEKAMLFAARNENAKILELLIQYGGNVDSHYDYHMAIAAAAESGLKKNVALLLKNGADVNEGDFELGNALCVVNGQVSLRPELVEIVKILEDAGGVEDCGG